MVFATCAFYVVGGALSRGHIDMCRHRTINVAIHKTRSSRPRMLGTSAHQQYAKSYEKLYTLHTYHITCQACTFGCGDLMELGCVTCPHCLMPRLAVVPVLSPSHSRTSMVTPPMFHPTCDSYVVGGALSHGHIDTYRYRTNSVAISGMPAGLAPMLCTPAHRQCHRSYWKPYTPHTYHITCQATTFGRRDTMEIPCHTPPGRTGVYRLRPPFRLVFHQIDIFRGNSNATHDVTRTTVFFVPKYPCPGRHIFSGFRMSEFPGFLKTLYLDIFPRVCHFKNELQRLHSRRDLA